MTLDIFAATYGPAEDDESEKAINKEVCAWSLRFGVAMSDVGLNNLVDNIAAAVRR